MATITQLATTENGTDSRTIINTNFTNVNNELVTASSDIDTAQTDITALQNTRALKAGDTFTGQIKQAKGADLASAATVDLGAATGNYVNITGTTTITSFGTTTAGTQVKATFSGALTLTHNATSLILPTGANIATVAGDTAEFVSLGSGNWKCTNYVRATGVSLGAVDVAGLTEDTVGDMDADFALVYDNSAAANRKQKISVFKASDAEKRTGTATNKFVTVSQTSNTTNRIATDLKTAGVSFSGAATTLYSITIPANTFRANTSMRMGIKGYGGNKSSGVATLTLKFGGYTLASITAADTAGLSYKNTSFSVDWVNTSGLCNIGNSYNISSGINLTVDNTFEVVGDSTGSGGTQEYLGCYVFKD